MSVKAAALLSATLGMLSATAYADVLHLQCGANRMLDQDGFDADYRLDITIDLLKRTVRERHFSTWADENQKIVSFYNHKEKGDVFYISEYVLVSPQRIRWGGDYSLSTSSNVFDRETNVLIEEGDAYYCTDLARPPAAKGESVTITTASGQHDFLIEVVRLPGIERELLYHAFMPENEGVLLDFKTERAVRIDTHHVYIPLDVVFVSKTGKVVGLFSDVSPMSQRELSIATPTFAVLELNKSVIAQIDLKVGDSINLPLSATQPDSVKIDASADKPEEPETFWRPRKPGLWLLMEQTSTNAAAPVAAAPVKICIDPATDMLFYKRRPLPNVHCSNDINQKGDVVIERRDCTFPRGITVHSNNKITFVGDDGAYIVDATSNASTGANTHKTIKEVWAGPCPSDMKPGDLIVNGTKINIMTVVGKNN